MHALSLGRSVQPGVRRPMSDVALSPDAHAGSATRARWTVAAVEALFELPFPELLFRAQQTHRAHHAPNTVQLSTLLSIKTGGCPEDCGYCPQAARHHTAVDAEPMLDVGAVRDAAQAAKDAGASRFCMGAAWRGPRDRDLEPVLEMVRDGEIARPRDLLHARHAEGRAGGAPA